MNFLNRQLHADNPRGRWEHAVWTDLDLPGHSMHTLVAAFNPCLPVAQLALPAFTISARIIPCPGENARVQLSPALRRSGFA